MCQKRCCSLACRMDGPHGKCVLGAGSGKVLACHKGWESAENWTRDRALATHVVQEPTPLQPKPWTSQSCVTESCRQLGSNCQLAAIRLCWEFPRSAVWVHLPHLCVNTASFTQSCRELTNPLGWKPSGFVGPNLCFAQCFLSFHPKAHLKKTMQFVGPCSYFAGRRSTKGTFFAEPGKGVSSIRQMCYFNGPTCAWLATVF